MLVYVSEDKRGGRLALPEDVLLDASYDAWGNVLDYAVDGVSFGTDLSQWPVPFGFAGGLLDRDTGLVRFGARDYDPTVGRWTAKDLILFNGGQTNLYVYVGNDPVNRIDSNGLFGLAIGISVGAGIWSGGDFNVGIGFDFSNGNLTVFNYVEGAATAGVGDYVGVGIDGTIIFGSVEQFAGAAVAARAEVMGVSIGMDHGGSFSGGLGPGWGSYMGVAWPIQDLRFSSAFQ